MDNNTRNRVNLNRDAEMKKIADKQRLFEMSSAQKQQLFQQAFRAIDGIEDNVHTFCILTGENPMGEVSSNFINRRNNKDINQYLKDGNFAWQPVRGAYGEKQAKAKNGELLYNEDGTPLMIPSFEFATKIIFNVRLSDAKALAAMTYQHSFIFGRKEVVMENGEPKGKVFFDLYVIDEENGGYVYKETKDYYIDMSGATNYYTQLGKKKFSIPFDYFNESCMTFNRAIAARKKKSSRYKSNFDRYVYRVLDESRNGKTLYYWRGFLYRGLFD